MTTNTDIVNRALAAVGTRTTVTDAELAGNTTNEAIQANLNLTKTRDELLRMAPWDCAVKTANLIYISSTPGTSENMSPATPLWQAGQPAPPWAYEYQYPNDCLRACWIIPANQTGFSGGVPITTAVTGGVAAWTGPPVRFKIQIDEFIPAIAVAINSGGLNYDFNDIVTLAYGPNTSPPIGAPAQIRVLTISFAGEILTCELVNSIADSTTPFGGSYFNKQLGSIAQGSTTGVGFGATFTLTFGDVRGSQRVILTNQEFATLAYCKRVTDPNTMDELFQRAWINVLAATLCDSLTGDKAKSNGLINLANRSIEEARKVDGNEGLTVNDVLPDWLRVRGIDNTGYVSGPWSGFDWGSAWPAA